MGDRSYILGVVEGKVFG